METIFWLPYRKLNVELAGKQKIVGEAVVKGLIVEGTLVGRFTSKKAVG